MEGPTLENTQPQTRQPDVAMLALGPLRRGLALLFGGCIAVAAAPHTTMNILFLMADDLRPELRSFGSAHIHSPNIDALAAKSLVLASNYVTTVSLPSSLPACYFPPSLPPSLAPSLPPSLARSFARSLPPSLPLLLLLGGDYVLRRSSKLSAARLGHHC